MSKVNTINFTIQAPTVTGNVSTPQDVTVTSKVTSGGDVEFNTGSYFNNENVAVTLTFNALINLVNCVFVSNRWHLADGSFSNDATVTVEPGAQVMLLVTVTGATEPVGHSDVDASFDVDVTIENVTA